MAGIIAARGNNGLGTTGRRVARATDSRDQLADFSKHGASSVDLAAPGASVLSTYVNWGPVQEVFSDDFETPLTGRWITGGSPDTWTRTPFAATRSGRCSLSNSLVGGYQNNTENWAELVQGLDLSGRRDCAATIWTSRSGCRSDRFPIAACMGNVVAMELAEYHAWWWKHQGGRELRRLLVEDWDPIHVKDSPEAADEYDGYRSAVVGLLRDGASTADIAAHLSKVEQTRMDFTTTPDQLMPLAERLVRWYPDSLTRWEASRPGRRRLPD